MLGTVEVVVTVVSLLCLILASAILYRKVRSKATLLLLVCSLVLVLWGPLWYAFELALGKHYTESSDLSTVWAWLYVHGNVLVPGAAILIGSISFLAFARSLSRA